MASPRSFAPAVSQHAAAMRRTAAALVGWADAEDVAQEAVLRAWQAWESLRDEEAVRGWLLRITVTMGLQRRRGSFGRQRSNSEPLSDERIEELATLERSRSPTRPPLPGTFPRGPRTEPTNGRQ